MKPAERIMVYVLAACIAIGVCRAVAYLLGSFNLALMFDW